MPRWWRSLYEGLTYRGREGHWAWILHRVTGVGVLLFLALHIVDIFLISLGPQAFDALLILYKSAASRVLEVFLVFAVLYHALNGLRIVIVDFLPGASRAQVPLFWAQVVVFLTVFIPAAVGMLAPLFGRGPQ